MFLIWKKAFHGIYYNLSLEAKSSAIQKTFVDTVRLAVYGGTGGMGLPKYRGIGGKGGSVYLEASPRVQLKDILKKYKNREIRAESGKNSKTMQIYGNSGKDKILKVPVGVIVYDELFRKIGELNEVGNRLVVAEGGPGGSFTSKPPYSGSKGHSQIITIDLKLIADVGLIGFPNAGKSSLLKAISRAKPEIAAYAFTTLRPNIGVLEYPDFRQIKMADLPGLIEGASQDLGMGHTFLKHVERSSVLLLVVDIHGFQLSPQCQFRNCVETVVLLNKELELYNKDLLDKPTLLALNKMDLPGGPSTYKEMLSYLEDLSSYATRMPAEFRPEKFFKIDKILPISAKCDKESVNVLKNEIRSTLDKYFEISRADIMTKEEIQLCKKLKKENIEISTIVM